MEKPTNNRALNPFGTAAALVITREEKSRPSEPIFVSLTFSKRTNVSTKAKDKTGNPVIAAFSLAVTSATFELHAKFVDAPGHALTVQDPMHEASAIKTTRAKTVENEKSSRAASAAVGATVSGGLASKGTNAAAKLVGNVKAALSRGTSSTTTRTTSGSTENVLAVKTAPDTISWSIGCSPGDAHIRGQVFMPTPKRKHAAKVVRSGAGKDKAFEVVGTVRAAMYDLTVGSVKFFRPDGSEVHLADLDPELKPPLSTMDRRKELVDQHVKPIAELRGRVMRELIRKELASQGLDTSGAVVEICKVAT